MLINQHVAGLSPKSMCGVAPNRNCPEAKIGLGMTEDVRVREDSGRGARCRLPECQNKTRWGSAVK